MNKMIFGPVLSRRLGLSLGIDLTLNHACSLNCRYCQLPFPKKNSCEREKICDPQVVLHELENYLRTVSTPDWITFSGTGEPTLDLNLGYLIYEIKKRWEIPVCVITNGTLIFREDVQSDLMSADRILPTLSTVSETTFTALHRPCKSLKFSEILSGLEKFLGKFPGVVEIEVFICPGINDSKEEMVNLGKFLATLPKLDGIYLNTAIRPAREGISAATKEDLEVIKGHFPDTVPISTAFDPKEVQRKLLRINGLHARDIISLLARHPCTIDQMSISLGFSEDSVAKQVEVLQKLGKVTRIDGNTWSLQEK